jgi:hypothetical protein
VFSQLIKRRCLRKFHQAQRIDDDSRATGVPKVSEPLLVRR